MIGYPESSQLGDALMVVLVVVVLVGVASYLFAAKMDRSESGSQGLLTT